MAIEQCPVNSCGEESDLELLKKIGIIVYSAFDESRVEAENAVLEKIDQLAFSLNNGKILPANLAHMKSIPYVAQVYVSLVSGRVGNFAWESLPENYVPVVVIDGILSPCAEVVYSKARMNWILRVRGNISYIFLVDWSELRVHVNDSYKGLVLRSNDLKIKK